MPEHDPVTGRVLPVIETLCMACKQHVSNVAELWNNEKEMMVRICAPCLAEALGEMETEDAIGVFSPAAEG